MWSDIEKTTGISAKDAKEREDFLGVCRISSRSSRLKRKMFTDIGNNASARAVRPLNHLILQHV